MATLEPAQPQHILHPVNLSYPFLNTDLFHTFKELSDLKFALDQAAIVAITDEKGKITYVNDNFCQLSQYSREELLGQDHRIINSGYHPPEFFQALWQTIQSGEVWKGEIKNKAKDGSCYWVDTTIVPFLYDDGQPFQYFSIRVDITERKEAEEQLKSALERLQKAQLQLIQNEKLSSMGQLVSGVAHEINNPVNFIYGNLNFLQEYAENLLTVIQLYQNDANPQKIEKTIEEIDLDFIIQDIPQLFQSMKTGAERIRETVVSLRNFARHDEAEYKAVDIHEGIDNALVLLQYRFHDDNGEQTVQVNKNYQKLPKIECYAGQINQVFMYLLGNALDAIEENDKPGELTITTQDKPNSIVIKIRDNGCGMSLATQQQVFNPFFTTKEVGKGTGMGLAVSHQIIEEQNGGHLSFISSLGEGTEFMIELPKTVSVF